MKNTRNFILSFGSFASALYMLFVIFYFSPSFSQPANDPVLLTISGEEIRLNDFKSVFMKNNKKDSVRTNKELDAYIELFTNYKLKVKEARSTGMDTSAAFRSELAGYRTQLAKPYLTDKAIEDKLLSEAYERKLKDVKASHIVVNLAPDAEPKDTAIAYKRIMQIRSRILKGEPFEKVAREASDDPTAKEDGGNLGWFTVFQTGYRFESCAYTQKAGDVSMPVRSKKGYHLVKVTGTRDAIGTMRAAHILTSINGKSKEDSLKAKSKIDEIYSKLNAGEKFEDLAKQNSHDKGSGMRGGELPPFSTGKMVEQFEEAVSLLKTDGDFSTPFLSEYGWHIGKRIERKPIPKFDELKDELKTALQKDSRSDLVTSAFVQRVKKEYGFKENSKTLRSLYPLIDDSFFDGKWKKPVNGNWKEMLCTIGEKTVAADDFLLFIEKNQKKRSKSSAAFALNEMYKKFSDELCIGYEDKILEKKYPDFAALMKEYSDGILLFELTDKRVWSKAIKDTAGLQKFYEVNKKNYMWEDRLEAAIFRCSDEMIADKTRKLVEKQAKKGWTNDQVLRMVNTDSLKKAAEVEEGKYLKGENEALKNVEWKAGLSQNFKIDKKVVFVNVKKIIKPEPKTLFEARGVATTDFQNYLEREWMDELRKKHPVIINQDVLNLIKPNPH